MVIAPLNQYLYHQCCEPGFVAAVNGENAFTLAKGFTFQLSDQDAQQAKDPMGPANPQALNRYSYVLDNPLRYTDPTGHWRIWADKKAGIFKIVLSQSETANLSDDCLRAAATSAIAAAIVGYIGFAVGGPATAALTVLIGGILAAAFGADAAFAKNVSDRGNHLEFYLDLDTALAQLFMGPLAAANIAAREVYGSASWADGNPPDFWNPFAEPPESRAPDADSRPPRN